MKKYFDGSVLENGIGLMMGCKIKVWYGDGSFFRQTNCKKLLDIFGFESTEQAVRFSPLMLSDKFFALRSSSTTFRSDPQLCSTLEQ